METISYNKILKQFMIVVMLLSGFGASYAQAGLIPTNEMINVQDQSYTQSDLQNALASEELSDQLQTMGVDVEQLHDRIASLTPQEIQQLNAELEQQPAGEGVLGALLVIFVVFVITDALCATDLFTFVRCINK